MESPFVEVAIEPALARATVDPVHARRLCAGHFPDDPLLPGAFLVELMADLAARLLDVTTPPAAVERCVFHTRVRPSAAITIVARRAGDDTVAAELTADGVRAAQATLLFAGSP